MFEYKSEMLGIHEESKGRLRIVKTIVDRVDIAKLDELINARAAEGWELVTHSAVVDAVAARVNVIVTFRREKK